MWEQNTYPKVISFEPNETEMYDAVQTLTYLNRLMVDALRYVCGIVVLDILKIRDKSADAGHFFFGRAESRHFRVFCHHHHHHHRRWPQHQLLHVPKKITIQSLPNGRIYLCVESSQRTSTLLPHVLLCNT